MKEWAAKPALRIRHIVYGRRSEGRRVTNLVDQRGEGEERAIAEEVVLRRWRRRRFEGYVFRRARLSSTVWRSLPVMLGTDVERWVAFDMPTLAVLREAALPKPREPKLRTPSADTVHAGYGSARPSAQAPRALRARGRRR